MSTALQTPSLDLQVPDDGPMPMAHQQVAAPIQSAEHWGGDESATSTFNAPRGALVSEIAVTSGSGRTKELGLILGAAALVMIFAWFAWVFVTEGIDPYKAVKRLFVSETPVIVPQKVAVKVPVPAKNALEVEVVKVLPSPGLSSTDPYSVQRNAIAQAVKLKQGMMTPETSQSYLEQLSGQFYYQRYQAVNRIISERWQGSDKLLRDAVSSGKFWMRMNALIGLTDLGYMISAEDIALALGDAQSDLRARYFEKLTVPGRCGSACMFVVRASIPYLDSKGRLQALKLVIKEDSEIAKSYLVAALFDSDTSVQTFAQEALLHINVPDVLWWEAFDKIFNQTKNNGDVLPIGRKA
jgi:hypothetical protein